MLQASTSVLIPIDEILLDLGASGGVGHGTHADAVGPVRQQGLALLR
jgi:hypothetical protein